MIKYIRRTDPKRQRKVAALWPFYVALAAVLVTLEDFINWMHRR